MERNLRSERDGTGESSSGISDARGWLGIWRCNLPAKIKHFIWKACSDTLPTRSNLQSRHVLIEEYCPICKHSEESVMHILFSCPCAREFWMWSQSVWDRVISDFEGNVVERFGVVSWLIWSERNAWVFRNQLRNPKEVGRGVLWSKYQK